MRNTQPGVLLFGSADTAEVLSSSGTLLFWHPRVSKVVQDVKYEQECANDETCDCSSRSVLKFAALCHSAKDKTLGMSK